MSDYGHELLFGSFVTPTGEQPQHAVAIASISEGAGLDLVTFQDHPYQSSFLDTWTLLSYVAARTTTIHVAPNVANLPLRLPSVLARSAASLDLLSGGRVELGLGAGAFWDAMQAMGAQRLTAKQSVQAVGEAIEIIRGIWDADTPHGVRVDGEFYQAIGAQRGPAPAHDIGIWLGAYKPAMLALTGRMADGWLPSLGYVRPEDLAESNARIDDAAVAAGRKPEDIRRLLNIVGAFGRGSAGLLQGPPQQWVEQLAELTLLDGISAFILGGDDPKALETFGREVAPALRELVAAERAHSSAPATSRALEGDRERLPDLGGSGKPAMAETAGAPAGDPARTQYDRLGLTPTPDDGERVSGEQLWDESTRPTRPESSPEVVYTDHGRAIGSHLIDVHDHLRQELMQIRGIVESVREGATAPESARAAIDEMTLRQNNWTVGGYCAAYCRMVAVHHGLEDDAIFPHLRSCERGLEPVIDRLLEEHNVIHDVLDLLDKALVELVASPGDFTGLQRAVDILTDTLLSHLSYEERELVEPLARHGFYKGQIA